MLSIDGKNYIYALYDVDDVLNDLNATTCKILGIDGSIMTRFNVTENPSLTKEQQEALINQWGMGDTFKLVHPMPGIERICDIEKTGKAVTGIRSSNLSQEVLEVKREWLRENVPQMDTSRVTFILNYGYNKKADDRADIVIEDCIGNLLKYGEKVKKVLINKTWNQAEAYEIRDEDYGIMRVRDLNEAVDLVEELVNNWVEA